MMNPVQFAAAVSDCVFCSVAINAITSPPSDVPTSHFAAAGNYTFFIRYRCVLLI